MQTLASKVKSNIEQKIKRLRWLLMLLTLFKCVQLNKNISIDIDLPIMSYFRTVAVFTIN